MKKESKWLFFSTDIHSDKHGGEIVLVLGVLYLVNLTYISLVYILTLQATSFGTSGTTGNV